MLIQTHEASGPQLDETTLSERDRQALSRTRQFLGELVVGVSVGARDDEGEADQESAVLVHSARPDGKTKRGVALGEEADRRNIRAAKDAGRKTMRERRPDGSKRRIRITPDGVVSAREHIDLELKGMDGDGRIGNGASHQRAVEPAPIRHITDGVLPWPPETMDEVEAHTLDIDKIFGLKQPGELIKDPRVVSLEAREAHRRWLLHLARGDNPTSLQEQASTAADQFPA
jgi:hypothetical protein